MKATSLRRVHLVGQAGATSGLSAREHESVPPQCLVQGTMGCRVKDVYNKLPRTVCINHCGFNQACAGFNIWCIVRKAKMSLTAMPAIFVPG
jgi:ArsR family metal-binding transcriptional regulator